MNPSINWVADIAGDARITANTLRLACAFACLAGRKGRYRSRRLALTAAAQLSSRHAHEMLQDLQKCGFLKIHIGQGGRLDLEMMMPLDEAVPATEKQFVISTATWSASLGGENGR